MADDVRISVGLRNHRKTKRLRRQLGAGACWSLVCLFLYAGDERWTGDLSGMTDADIEEEAAWDGEPGAFVSALLEHRFLIGEPGARAIHDWQEHNPYAASKGQRIEKGKQAAAARWEKKNPAKSKGVDATSMPSACREHATTIAEQCPPAPAPAPTQPLEAKAKTKADAPSAKRGQRLAPDWQPSDADVAFAVEHRVNWRQEAESFRDYWCAKSGSDAAKLDWSATWRNWVRRSRKDMKPATLIPAKSKTRQAIENIGRMVNGGALADAGDWDGAGEAAGAAPRRLSFGRHDRSDGGDLD